MRLTAAKCALLKAIIQRLYERPFDSALFLKIADDACSIIGAHYFSLYLLSQAERPSPIFLSNNPPSFIPVYLSVAKEDFLIRDLIDNGGMCVLKRMREFDVPRNHCFIDAVQRERPISDVMYLPLKTGGALSGYFALARGGLDSPVFEDDELELFRFISSFINDAFERSLIPPPVPDDVAYLDFKGNVIAAGPRINIALRELFGEQTARLGSAARQRMSMFIAAYRDFLYGPFKVGMDRLNVIAEHGARGERTEYRFAFLVYKPCGLFIERDGIPCAQVRLLSACPVRLALAQNCSPSYSLTAREREVVRGIFQCKSNKAIAAELRIDESTVKRYTHNIYEKTGFKTRVELVLHLPYG